MSPSPLLQIPPLPDLPLRSLRSHLQRDLDPDPDLNPNLDLVVDTPEVAVPLYLFLPLLQGDLSLDPDLVLVLQEYPPTPFLSLPLHPTLLLLPLLLLHLRQPWPLPPIRPVNLSATTICRFCS